MELVRKPTGIYWARGTDPNRDGAMSPTVVEEDSFEEALDTAIQAKNLSHHKFAAVL